MNNRPHPMDSAVFFTQVALKNDLLTAGQTEACLEEWRDRGPDSPLTGVQDVAVSLGYMDLTQAALVTRAKDYARIRQEDLLLAEVLREVGLGKETDFQYVSRLQNATYGQGDVEIPRLLDVLVDDGVVDPSLLSSLRLILGEIHSKARGVDARGSQETPDECQDTSAGPDVGTGLTGDRLSAGTVSDCLADRGPVIPGLVAPAPLRNQEPGGPDSETRTSLKPSSEERPVASPSRTRHNLLLPGLRDKSARRVHPRFNVKGANVHFARNGPLLTLERFGKPSHLVNLSLGGIRIVSHRSVPVGERIKLLVQVPSLPGNINARAEVRYCNRTTSGSQNLIGAKFLKLSARDCHSIQELAGDPTLRNNDKKKRPTKRSKK